MLFKKYIMYKAKLLKCTGLILFFLLQNYKLKAECKMIEVISRQSFGNLNLKIPNIYKAEAYYQWPDYPGDHGTCFEKYFFSIGNDSACLEIAVPIEVKHVCTSIDSQKAELSKLEENIRFVRTTAKNFKSFTSNNGKLISYGLTFNEGFCVVGCKQSGSYYIELTGLRNTVIRDSILNSLTISP